MIDLQYTVQTLQIPPTTSLFNYQIIDYREDALTAIREAVELYRQLANDWSTVYNAVLADSLNKRPACSTQCRPCNVPQ
jgi:hypothetical protein